MQARRSLRKTLEEEGCEAHQQDKRVREEVRVEGRAPRGECVEHEEEVEGEHGADHVGRESGERVRHAAVDAPLDRVEEHVHKGDRPVN